MTTLPDRVAGERRVALAAYRLGTAAVNFRLSVERAYICAEHVSGEGLAESSRIPVHVDAYLGSITEWITALHEGEPDVPDLPARTRAFEDAARGLRAVLEAGWLSEDHRARLRHRQARLVEAESEDGYCWDFLALAGSSVQSTAWSPYSRAADCLGSVLPDYARALFDLGRDLTAVMFPLPSDHDPVTRVPRAINNEYLQGEVSPQIAQRIKQVREQTGLLAETPDRLEVTDQLASARRLHEAILAGLTLPALPEQQQPCAVLPATLAPSTPLGADEDLATLLALKRKMDPKNTYIGLSLPVLRLFRQIEELNRLPNDPVVILGPSGCGKTRLARFIHDNSERRAKPFLPLSADDVNGGDETIHRGRWAGYGRSSGLPGISASAITPGWLEENEGGTIFVDELHNLDESAANYLRKVFDGREIQRAAGKGDSVVPNVRLVFATYRDINELDRERKLPHDFIRRLQGRYLTVPHLSERKEDIPLFVEQGRNGRSVGECFLLALLRHDWPKEVSELNSAIRSAVVRKKVGERLVVSNLRGLVPDPILAIVDAMSQDEVAREAYSFLVQTLGRQGFGAGRRGAALQKRLAELLTISEPQVSRQLRDLGLNETSAGQEPPTS